MADDSELTPQLERERISPETGAGLAEGDWPPDWMVTYSDMTTILMTFFVLWYALTIANIDKDLIKLRQEQLDQLAQGVGEKTVLDLSKDEDFLRILQAATHQDPDADDGLQKSIDGDINLKTKFQTSERELRILDQFQKLSQEQQQIVLAELKALKEKAEEVRQFIHNGKLDNDVELKVTAEDVVIIPTAPLIFDEGRAVIKPTFYPLLDRIGGLLEKTGASIRVEGHTDNTPIHPRHKHRYPSNWELSATRAIAVANYFIDRGDIPPEQISAAAYGPSRPKYPDDDPELRGRNRRVEFHIYLGSETAGS